MISKSANELSDDPILISALEHYAYCPRQFALIHIEQEFADNVHTMRGNAVHGQVDEPGYEVMAGVRVERASGAQGQGRRRRIPSRWPDLPGGIQAREEASKKPR
jgi:hypothetical protein